MIATLPSIVKLKPNPHWAKLALFNRKDWSGCYYSDVKIDLAMINIIPIFR
jgi:hypothetical protein